MIKPDFLDKLNKKLCDALPSSLQTLKHDIEKNFHSILISTFNKLDLVTREEFDTQKKVLIRTRQKIEALEAEISKLENELKKNNI